LASKEFLPLAYTAGINGGGKMATKAKKTSTKVYCSVCPDWEIKHPERCSNTMTHKGQKRYFCTKKCKELFAKTPERYTYP
jgi:YHS domain-containing protein